MSTDTILPIEQDTSRVSYTITINGTQAPSTMSVISMAVQNEVNRIPTAWLSIGDGDAALADWQVSSEELFVPGNDIEITAGYEGIEETIFKGIVTRHSLRIREGRWELNVECRDKTV